MNTFDIVIIGGGPGGMSAGVMLSKAGKSVALIQQDHDSYGGVCLNRGCMPTKSLLKAADVYRRAKECSRYGLNIETHPINLEQALGVTATDLEKLRNMVQKMISDAGITTIRGEGSFQSEKEVIVEKADGSTEIVGFTQAIIATGSESIELPIAPFDGKYILSSDQILKNTEIPNKLLIIGGGVIGCEFATMYNIFGSDVTIVEGMETLLPREDKEAGEMLKSLFEDQGIHIKNKTIVDEIDIKEECVQVYYKGGSNPEIYEKVLVGVGRKPNINNLNLKNVGIEIHKNAVKVNELLQTNIPHIYCVGDANGGMMLAHSAEKEGELVARNILEKTSINLDETAVPRVAFCHPEMAAVGITKDTDGITSFCIPQVPNGRSILDKVQPAFVKLFIKTNSNELAGAIIIGEYATEMIHELALAVENHLTLDQIENTVHAHPTHSENIIHAVRCFN